MNINKKLINNLSNKFNKNKKNILAKNSVTSVGVRKIITNNKEINKIDKIFSKVVDLNLKKNITDQKNTGRCWLFAYLNVLKIDMVKKYKIEKFEFSENYLFFYDKLEKSNFFLNEIVKSRNKPINDRLIQWLLKEPITDGGQSNMVINLLKKYGSIPKENMGDSYHTNDSYLLNNFLNDKLREYAMQLRTCNKKNIKNIIIAAINEIYNILVIFLGEPPKKISWNYYKTIKGKKIYKSIKNITPSIFFKKYVPVKLDEYVTIINYPCKKYNNIYNIKNNNNMIDGDKNNYLNINLKTFKSLVKENIKNNNPTWIGIDTTMFINEKKGIYSKKIFNYENVFNTTLKMNKCNGLKYLFTNINHAVILKGYNEINGKIDKWLVENSYGPKSGLSGEYILTDDWFNDYVYEAVIKKKYLSNKLKKVLKKKAIELPYYDAFGSVL